jgi:alkylation response protein AidB-like acyl-CoA dehydrogenase
MTIFKTIGVVGALALSALVSAASPVETLYVRVPFSFMVGEKQFAAGDYRVQATNTGLILVQGEGRGAMAISVPGHVANGGTLPSLRFVRSNNQLYLAGVSCEGEADRNLPLHTADQRSVTFASR